MRKLVVIACIFSLLVSAAVLAGCVVEDNSTQTPGEVVTEFLHELASKDTNTAWDMLSRESQKALHSEPEFEALVLKTLSEADELDSAEIVKTSKKGNVATVTFTAVIGGKKETNTLKLVKEDGAWKISLLPSQK
jgi:hypothetical protein